MIYTTNRLNPQFLKYIFTFILVLSLFGCGNKTGEIDSALKEIQRPVLKVAVKCEDYSKYQAVFDNLNAKTGYYKLEIMSDNLSLTHYDDDLRKLIDDGTAPDLMMFDNGSYDLIKNGSFLDITKQAKSDNKLKLKYYFKAAMDSVTYDSKIYGLPYQCTPVVVFYNKDMFIKTGVPFPKSGWKWEDFRDTAKKLTKDTDGDGKTDQWGYNMWFSRPWPLMNMLKSYGCDFDNIQSNEFVNALNLYYNMIFKDKSVVTIDDLMKNKNKCKYAMWCDIVTVIFPADSNTGMIEMPSETKKYTDADIGRFMINAKTRYKEASYKALADLTTALFDGEDLPPTSYEFDEATKKGFPNIDMNIIKNVLNYNLFNTNMIDENLYGILDDQIINPITNGTKTPEQAVNDAAKKLYN